MDNLLKKMIQRENKKGFTLVELLAVMVVLALIIVLVAPNVLQSMNQSKQSAMKTFAKRMMNEAKTQYELDKLNSTTGITAEKSYLIKTKLAPDQNQYVGCVTVSTAGVYTIYIVDKGNAYYIGGVQGSTGIDGATITTSGNTTTATTDTAVVKSGSNKCAAA